MIEMDKREKLIIGLLIGVILIGGLYSLSALKPKPVEISPPSPPLFRPSAINIEEDMSLIKEDDFEYEKTFDFPDNWRDIGAFGQMEWHLELPDQHAETTTEKAFIGGRGVKVWSDKKERSILDAGDFEHWNAPKKAMSYYFLLPEGQFEAQDAGVWINVDLVDYEKKEWKNAVVGINRFGDIYYGDGYVPKQSVYKAKHFNGGFILDYDKWYKLELYADFDKFGDDDGMILKLYIDGEEYAWAIPLTRWSDSVVYPFSFGAYYLGVSQKYAYFDEVKCYIGK
jgi:hypothetical protein